MLLSGLTLSALARPNLDEVRALPSFARAVIVVVAREGAHLRGQKPSHHGHRVVVNLSQKSETMGACFGRISA